VAAIQWMNQISISLAASRGDNLQITLLLAKIVQQFKYASKHPTFTKKMILYYFIYYNIHKPFGILHLSGHQYSEIHRETNHFPNCSPALLGLGGHHDGGGGG